MAKPAGSEPQGQAIGDPIGEEYLKALSMAEDNGRGEGGVPL